MEGLALLGGIGVGVLIDLLISRKTFWPQFVVGACLIVIGFGGLTLHDILAR